MNIAELITFDISDKVLYSMSYLYKLKRMQDPKFQKVLPNTTN